MIKVGDKVTCKSFAGVKEGLVIDTTPSVPCHWYPSVNTVGTVTVKHGDLITCYPEACVTVNP